MTLQIGRIFFIVVAVFLGGIIMVIISHIIHSIPYIARYLKLMGWDKDRQMKIIVMQRVNNGELTPHLPRECYYDCYLQTEMADH